MSNPVFPTLRKLYAGIDNPLFLGDIQVADQNALSALLLLSGCESGDFRIISGLDYILGTPNTYSPGLIYFHGDFFYSATAFNEGLYLATSYVDVLSETFDDTTARNIYTNQVATSTSTPSGNSPIFTGNMNTVRINNKYLQQQIVAILTITNALGTAADANLGTGTGQILTADQTYTQAQVNALLLQRAPSTVGSIAFVRDILGTFASNFDGAGLGIVYPWYNSLTGERWALTTGTAVAGGHTAPNTAGKAFIGQGTDAGSNVFSEGDTYGANHYQIVANDLPVLETDPVFSASTGGSMIAYTAPGTSATLQPLDVNSGSPNNPINIMQSSLALYEVIRLV